MFRLQDVSKEYSHKRGTVTALRKTTIDILRGEFVAIIGASGSGKTTLLSMLGGMLAPTSGQVIFDGQSLYDLKPKRRAQIRQESIGFVFQTFNLVSYLSAMENVQVPLMLAGWVSQFQQERVTLLLTRVGLQGRMHHKPSEMSIGQQQRVALARTLANDPSVILADEPTGNLDPETRQQVLTFLKELSAEGRTVILVTHDHDAASHASRTISLADGAIVSDTARLVRAAA